MKLDRTSSKLSMLCLGLAAATTLHVAAATITWGPATQIGADSDVNTTGTLLEADALGNAASPTVNGVTFTAWPGSSAYLAAGPSGASLLNSGLASPSAPFSDLSTSYQTLLTAGADNSSPSSLVLSNLTSGVQYEVQIWANNANGDPGAEIVDGQTTLFYCNAGIGGQPGSFALGTFTADGPTQEINLTDTNNATGDIVNALQLRSVSTTEPLSLGIAAAPTNTLLAVSGVTLTAAASGSGLSYQWWSDVGSPGTYTPISGATSQTFSVPGAGISVTNNYQVVVSNTAGAATSGVVTVTLIGPPSQGLIWGEPTLISGASDVDTNGATIFTAQASTGSNVVLNGVDFTQFLPLDYYTHPASDDYGSGNAFMGITNGTGSVSLYDGNGNVYYYPSFGSSSAPFTNLDANYQSVLSSAIGGLGNDNLLTLVFSNLAPSAVYGVQLWVDDSRSCCVSRAETVSDVDGDTANLNYNEPELPGGTGQYIIGEGYADANGTITVTLLANEGQAQQLNAFQLRSPSPFPPYMLPVQLSPSNFVYAGTALSVSGGAVSPVGALTTYQWQWNQGSGSALVNYTGAGATTSALAIDTTGFSNGNYIFQLVASNAYGTNISKPATVQIEALAAPVISAFGPASLTLYSDSAPVTIGGTVNGSTPLTLEWLSDNGTGSGVLTPVSGATSSSLAINPATLTANATYTYELIASNFLGVATSSPVVLTIAAIPQAPSSGISWGPPASAGSDNDISTSGSSVLALVANNPVTINGVPFQSFVPAGVSLPQGPGSYYGGSGESEITATEGSVTATLTAPNDTSGNPFYWYSGFTSSSAPFSQLSTNYQALLAGADGANNGPQTFDLAITGLVPGSNYLFQYWVNDPRGLGNIGDRYVILSDGGTNASDQTAPIQYELPLSGGVGSYAIGTTKADGSGDINITILGANDTQLNAFQLRQLDSAGAAAQPLLSAPQPAPIVQYVGMTGKVNIASVASGTEPLSYQWLLSSGSGFSAVTGATSDPFVLDTSSLSAGSYQYALVASNSVGSSTSAPVTVTIAPIPAALAQGVNWGPAANVIADSDISTGGSSVIAVLANNPDTINGVTFTNFIPGDANLGNGQDFSSQATFIAATNGAATITLTSEGTGDASSPFFWYTGFGVSETAFAALSSAYQGLEAGADGASAGADTWNFALAGLKPGDAYEIQFWVNDSRKNGYERDEILSDALGTSSVAIDFNASPTGANGGLGQFAVGVGKADSNGNIGFTVVGSDYGAALFGSDTQVNGLQVRDITSSGVVTPPGPLTITQTAGSIVLSWTGSAVLLESSSINGPWTVDSSATSPFTAPTTGAQQFFELRAQ